VDPKSATVTLDDGTEIKGDFIVAADGVHSVARGHIEGCDTKPFSSKKSAFRFLVDRQLAAEDPATFQYVQTLGDLHVWHGSDRRIVMYPTSNNTLLNFVCIHPEIETAQDSGEGWDQSTSLDKLLQVYESFDSSVLTLLSKADPRSVKVWTLLDMKVIPTWTTENLALLGDAAHPFLPHQGQGAGMAIEDAAALSTVLPFGTKKAEVPERLRLYQNIRLERAKRVQQYSRLAGKDPGEQDQGDSKVD